MLDYINSIVWGSGMLFLILITGLLFTLKGRFFQIFRFPSILKNTLFSLFKKSSAEDNSKISQFKTLSATLAATMGTGNIIGVATAIAIGGAGAIFWMWISAFLGMMVVYAENFLGSIYRYKNENGEWVGGPLAYLEKGLGYRAISVVYAVFCILASFGMGNLAQSNSIASAAHITLNIPYFITGIVTAILAAIIISGGIRRISSASQIIIPVLSAVYIIGSLIIIFINIGKIPSAFQNIIKGAFGLSAFGGGICGSAIKTALNTGLRRGVFSNEAGLGSSSLLHSSAESDSPHVQGMWGIFEVFTDTIVCCSLTALVILTSGVDTTQNAAAMVISAFGTGFGAFASSFISFSILLFAFATLISWSYCGVSSARFVFGEKAVKWYKFAFVVIIFVGAITKLEAVWTLSDIFNGFMAIPNLLGLLLLSSQVKVRMNKL